MCSRCPAAWIHDSAHVERAIEERAEAAAEMEGLAGRADRNAAWWVVLVELDEQIEAREAFLSHIVWC